jgi:putative phosphoribosyl transferase
VPTHPHTHLGVVAEPHHLVVNRQRVRELGLEATWLEDAVAHGAQEVSRRGAASRGARARQALAERRVIVVDDAAGTGATVRAAVTAVRAMGAREIIVALPVAPPRVVEDLRDRVDRVVCPATPGDLIWHGIYYPHPGEVSDDDIRRLLEQGRSPAALAGAYGRRAVPPGPPRQMNGDTVPARR